MNCLGSLILIISYSHSLPVVHNSPPTPPSSPRRLSINPKSSTSARDPTSGPLYSDEGKQSTRSTPTIPLPWSLLHPITSSPTFVALPTLPDCSANSSGSSSALVAPPSLAYLASTLSKSLLRCYVACPLVRSFHLPPLSYIIDDRIPGVAPRLENSSANRPPHLSR